MVRSPMWSCSHRTMNCPVRPLNCLTRTHRLRWHSLMNCLRRKRLMPRHPCCHPSRPADNQDRLRCWQTPRLRPRNRIHGTTHFCNHAWKYLLCELPALDCKRPAEACHHYGYPPFTPERCVLVNVSTGFYGWMSQGLRSHPPLTQMGATTRTGCKKDSIGSTTYVFATAGLLWWPGTCADRVPDIAAQRRAPGCPLIQDGALRLRASVRRCKCTDTFSSRC